MAGPRASPNSKPPPPESDWAEDPDHALLTDPGPTDSPGAPARSDRPEPLPAWARFPHVDPRRHGRAFDDEDEEGPGRSREDRDAETEQVLREIDGLRDEVRSRTRPLVEPTEPPSPAHEEAAPIPAAPPASPPDPAPPTPVDLWESPSSFLEERLRLADEAAADLGREVRSLAETWGRVHDRMQQLESEVRAAHQEMEFIHSAARGWNTLPRSIATATAALPAPNPRRTTSPVSSRTPARPGAPVAAAASVEAPYTGFTADRYNRTIGALKSRRRRLAGWTFVSAGLISVALVAATALARPAMPPIWLAVLPAVWMIPVPFFVLSFRGTQRVLRHNHLEVPGGPP